jgi:hypothetical protein
MNKILVTIESHIKISSLKKSKEIVIMTREYFERTCAVFFNGEIPKPQVNEELFNHVDKIIVNITDHQRVSFWQADISIIAFCLLDREPEKEYLDGDEDTIAFDMWELPNKYLHGLWDSIITESSIKRQLLGYCDSSMRFSEAGIDSNVISWNRIALLHGPPGIL